MKQKSSLVDDLEHITNYFYRNSEDFKIHNFESPIKGISDLSFTDYPEDIEKISKIIRSHGCDPVDLTLGKIIKV